MHPADAGSKGPRSAPVQSLHHQYIAHRQSQPAGTALAWRRWPSCAAPTRLRQTASCSGDQDSSPWYKTGSDIPRRFVPTDCGGKIPPQHRSRSVRCSRALSVSPIAKRNAAGNPESSIPVCGRGQSPPPNDAGSHRWRQPRPPMRRRCIRRWRQLESPAVPVPAGNPYGHTRPARHQS